MTQKYIIDTNIAEGNIQYMKRMKFILLLCPVALYETLFNNLNSVAQIEDSVCFLFCATQSIMLTVKYLISEMMTW